MADFALIARQVILTTASVALLGWVCIRALKRSEEPMWLIIKWVVSAIVIALMIWWVLPLADQGGGGAWVAVVAGLLCGLVMMFTWRRSIGELVARRFDAMYDGGELP